MENMSGFAIFEMKSLPKLCLTVLSQNLIKLSSNKQLKKINMRVTQEQFAV